MNQATDAREPVVAGSWYPGKKEELIKAVDSFMKNATQEKIPGKIKALVAPHAGYAYSGQVAAFAYKQVKGEKYKKVIVLAPSHHVSFSGAALSDKTHYRTPLGNVPISDEARDLMKETKLVKYVSRADEKEHSLEIQLPFLQRVLGEFSLIPLVLGELSEQDIEELAGVLLKRLDDETLIVASTDLSHYYPYDTAVDLDRDCIDSVVKLDTGKAERCQMCGMYPVLVAMNIAKKLSWKAKLLKYENSGDVTGDTTGVVGYASIAFYTPEDRK